MLTVDIIIIIAVCIVSITAFSNTSLMYRFQFNAWSVFHRKEYFRLFTHGFLHGDWMHLLINMFVLWSFGGAVLYYFASYLPGNNQFLYALLFITALPVSSLYSLIKYRDNSNYNAIGASGAVSAVVFTSIFFDPYRILLLFAVIPIPGIVFGVLYLWYSARMSSKQVDNIGHDAHFWGAVYGFVFPVIYEPRLILVFWEKLISF